MKKRRGAFKTYRQYLIYDRKQRVENKKRLRGTKRNHRESTRLRGLGILLGHLPRAIHSPMGAT